MRKGTGLFYCLKFGGVMSILICKNCGGTTNTTTCKWSIVDNDIVTDNCFVKWVDDKPVKGCSYDKVTNKWYKKWLDDIIKKG